MRKIRILGIAPFVGIKILLDELASKRKDMEIDTYVGDMNDGLELAKKYYKNYDIIISRGGTADLIRQANLLPVVSIKISVYDIFRSIKLAMSSQKKIALIGFPSITENAVFLKEMLQLDLPIFTIHSLDESPKVFQTLSKESYDMVVTGANTSSYAAQYNLPAILINSGTESISSAIDLAFQIASQRLHLTESNNLFQDIIENASYSTVVYTKEKEIYYQSVLAPLPEPIQNVLLNNLPSCFETDSQKIYFEYYGLIYSIISKKVQENDNTLIIYYISTRRVPLSFRKNGIRYTSYRQAEIEYKNSFSGIANINAFSREQLRKYSDSHLPIAIIGDSGSGKTAAINYLYLCSIHANEPMAIIDCSKVNEKMWNFLTDNSNSPLSDTNTTIYFKNISRLDEKQYFELIDLIDDLQLYRRNTILFTLDSHNGQLDTKYQILLDKLHCLTLYTTSLKDNIANLPEIVSLYINHLNLTYGKSVVSVESGGMEALKSFNWEKNYDQLMRILNQLVIPSTAAFIDEASVKQILKKEMLSNSNISSSATNYENMTLEEINLQIVKQELAKANGNQRKVAEKLGISRTTMWRMLQRDPS